VKVLVKAANEHFVSPSERFLSDVEEVLGSGHVRLVAKPAAPAPPTPAWKLKAQQQGS
jgi:hypothetical protein